MPKLSVFVNATEVSGVAALPNHLGSCGFPTLSVTVVFSYYREQWLSHTIGQKERSYLA